MKIPRQKISPRQRDRLLQVYLHMGQQVVEPICIKLGLAPDYAAKHACEIGVNPRRKHRGSGKPIVAVNHSDPRWSRAIAIGPVIA